jgi:formylglycine-generating enzyme required for sulfatase activity
MRAAIVIGVLFLFTAASGAATVDLRGAIVDELGDSLPGMLLFLKSNPALQCSTDTRGAFHLSNGTSVLKGCAIHGTFGIRIRPAGNGQGFLVRTYGIEKITKMEIFRADGRRLEAMQVSGSGTAEHVVPFSTSGVHFIKISTAKESKVFKILPTMGAVTFVGTDVPSAPPKNVLAKTASSLIDTLVFFGYKYRTALIGLASHEQADMLITVQKSNTWQNCLCGPLLKWQGMVKIIGKTLESVDTCDFEMGQLCDTIWGKKDGRPTSDFEQPIHTVRLTHNFLMDTAEISQVEFDTVMKKRYTKYVTPVKWKALYGKGDNYPAYAVSWDDAVLFCNARSKRDHFDTAYTYSKIVGTPGSHCKLVGVKFQLFTNGYRLPTEAEWEYCGRAGMREDYWWNTKGWQDYKNLDSIEGVDEFATWTQNSWNLGSGNPGFGTHPVDSAELGWGGPAHNYYNLKGMYGNVSEWCNDFVGPYEWGTFVDPIGPAWSSDTTKQHVIRGGNWGSTIFYLRGANRYFYAPGEDKDVFIGFRTIRVIGDEM